MNRASHKQIGLRLGMVTLAIVALGFVGLFAFGPDPAAPGRPDSAQATQAGLFETLTDMPTRRAVAALQTTSPGTYARLHAVARNAIEDGADAQALSEIVLEALFAQFQEQARHVKAANATRFQAIVSDLASGLAQLKTADSAWCEGETIAAFLSQNEADLVPTLLAEFPYGSAQYEWAMAWMTTVLTTANQGHVRPMRHRRPDFRDEAILQQEGLALGSEQWALGLQIAAFANSEGTSYAAMRDVIAGMDVCDLGIAIDTVSGRLPGDVRARIWADLMPEIMVGNTPYVMYRVTDYFFIG